MSDTLVSIIIPTHNEGDVIARNLKAIRKQTYKNIEVIVVDDASTDNTVEIAKEFTKHVYARKRAERSVQRNFGASKASGKYLLFLDADMEMTPTVVDECVKKAEENSKIGAIAIPERPIASNYLEKVKAFERSFYSEQGDPDTDAARFFLKKAFDEVKGYDLSLTGPEDWDLPEMISKKGYEVTRIKSLINHYERVPSIFKLAHKKYYYALTAHRYFAKHKLSVVGPKSVYFLRPVFYRNWRKLVSNPVLAMGMVIVLTIEQLAGALGYFIGRNK